MKEEIIKIKFHSVVDVITNSSTVIYTYQNSTDQAKELVQVVLDLMGIKDKNPDDIFYYGEFCEDDRYLESRELPEECPKVNYDSPYKSEERKNQYLARNKWLDDLKLSILKGEILKPEWMEECETDEDSWAPSSYLNLVVKDEKFSKLAKKIKKLLGSVDADGGRDG